MPDNNLVHLRGEVAEEPYFDLVPNHRPGAGRIAFLRMLVYVQRSPDQPLPDEMPADQMRVVAYGKLAEALRTKVRAGDWLVVRGWIQVRRRPGEHGVVTEIIAQAVDHFMHPLIPGSPLMQQLEELAARHDVSARVMLDWLLTYALRQVEHDLSIVNLTSDRP